MDNVKGKPGLLGWCGGGGGVGVIVVYVEASAGKCSGQGEVWKMSGGGEN
jgi:hypothetical protein